jgi:hypothetical protein
MKIVPAGGLYRIDKCRQTLSPETQPVLAFLRVPIHLASASGASDTRMRSGVFTKLTKIYTHQAVEPPGAALRDGFSRTGLPRNRGG